MLLETGKSLNLQGMAKKMDMVKDGRCAIVRAVARGLLKSPVLQSVIAGLVYNLVFDMGMQMPVPQVSLQSSRKRLCVWHVCAIFDGAACVGKLGKMVEKISLFRHF